MFLLSFAILLIIQFLAMLYHRYTHTLNSHHFTFISFHFFAAVISDLYVTASLLTHRLALKTKQSNVVTFRYWRFDLMAKKLYYVFKLVLDIFPHYKQGNCNEYIPALMENYNNISCCSWDYCTSISHISFHLGASLFAESTL